MWISVPHLCKKYPLSLLGGRYYARSLYRWRPRVQILFPGSLQLSEEVKHPDQPSPTKKASIVWLILSKSPDRLEELLNLSWRGTGGLPEGGDICYLKDNLCHCSLAVFKQPGEAAYAFWKEMCPSHCSLPV